MKNIFLRAPAFATYFQNNIKGNKKQKESKNPTNGVGFGIARWFFPTAFCVFWILISPIARATPYASCVTNNAGTIQFYLNEGGATVTVIYNDGSTNANFNGITTGTDLASGFYSFSLGSFTSYTILVSKAGSGSPSVIQTLSESGATVNPRGIDVNRVPTSPFFGNVYWVNGGGTPPGIFWLNADLSYVNGNSSPLAGGVTTFGSSGTVSGQSPDFISVAPDGFVIVGDASTNGAAVYRIDPTLSTNELLLGPVGLNPAKAEGIHGTIESPPLVTGSTTDGNLVLYDIDGELSPYNSIQVYDIGGGSLPWTSPPTYTGYEVGLGSTFDSITLGGNEYCGLSIGTNGYIYASTYRNNLSNPDLQIYDATGKTNLWNSWEPAGTVYNPAGTSGTPTNDAFMPTIPTTSGSVGGAMVGSQVSPDNAYIGGVDAYNQIILCSLTNGIPNLLSFMTATNPAGTNANCRGLAWDAADNFYVSSSGLGELQEWSLGLTAVAVTTGNANGVTGFQVGYPPYFKPSVETNAAVYEGTTLTIPATALGSGPLGYQWYDVNGRTNVAMGVTNGSPLNATLTINNVPAAWLNDQLELTVTNAWGTTNFYVTIDVLTNAPQVVTAIPVTYTNLFTLYTGVSPAFSISAAGPALSYYWFTNNVLDAAISSTSSNMTWANVPPGIITNYCVISNYLGLTTNVWMAQVIAHPTNTLGGPASYPQAVLALNPIGYWRMNDATEDGADNGVGDNGYVCHDYAGGNDGIFTNSYIGLTDTYNPLSDPSDTSAQFGEESSTDFGDSLAYAIQGINFGSPAHTSVAFTIEAWVSGYQQNYDAGIVTLGWGGGGEQFNLDCGSDSGGTSHGFRFFMRDAGGTTHGVSSTNIAAVVGQGPWYHLVAVVDEISNQSVTFYINGQSAGSASCPSGSGVLASSYAMGIGSRMGSQSTNFNLQFLGNINDVAIFNYALNSNQVLNEYAESGIMPHFSQLPPANETVDAGGPLTIPVTAIGTPISGYLWSENGTPIAGAAGTTNGTTLNASLSYNNVPASWNNATLTLTVTNGYGTTNVSVTLTVLTAPSITNSLPSQVVLVQGQTYTYTVDAVGAVPLSYQWYTNGVADTTAGTTTTYTLADVQPGQSGETIQAVVNNSIGSASSGVSTVTVIATPTYGYAGAILGMHPIAYWPMHEVEAASPGDIETNYGTLGLLGTGYYPDWVAKNTGCMARGFPGAIAGDPDTAVFFNTNLIANQAGAYTNSLYIPHSSPYATLNPPFSVECWIYEETNGNESNSIWGQGAYEGLNAGGENGGYGTNGIGPRGIRFSWNAIAPSGTRVPGFTIYTYDDTPSNSTSVYTVCSMTNGAAPIAIDTWYHVVVTCDANTNFTIYTNGFAAASGAGVGLYSADYWTPLTIGTGKGMSQAEPCGVDEFAIYTNALSQAAILNHYQTGINPSPATSYFNTIVDAGPVIYYRMDSPAYVIPPRSADPLLYNFGSVQTSGSAVVSGIYSPGTLTGALPGPNTGGKAWSGMGGAKVAALSGVSSYADAGYSPAYNPSTALGTASNAFSVSLMFRGNPGDNLYQCIAGHSDSSWRVAMGANNAGGGAPGSVQFVYSTQISSTNNYNDGNWHQMVGVYQPGPARSTNAGTVLLYVDGAINTTSANVSTNGITTGSSFYDVTLGAAPDYTNNTAGVGRQFDGQVCEVALFTNALTAAQVSALYNASGAPPLVNLNPTNIVFLVSDGLVHLSWPADHLGWTLEVQTNALSVGLSTNWVPVSGSTGVNTEVIPINLTNGTVFYRLMHP